MSDILRKLVRERRSSGPRGIYSVCSAHPWVIEAALRQAHEDGSPSLIEATSNQVNQLGGYTGMQPQDFRRQVHAIAEQVGFDTRRLILGGDHLGPNPWRQLPAEEALARAEVMVDGYVEAGFTKIHLDTSMPCADDDAEISPELVAERAARLCRMAESRAAHTGNEKPVYVIGTEVPPPGGARADHHGIHVTTREAAAHTLAVHREAFVRAGLESAWPRVVALVVQPGVEFGHDSVIDYVPEKATELRKLLEQEKELVFEAHSTDYQRPQAYTDLVQDGFAILKVGPALTFALREALFALSEIEQELVDTSNCSHLPDVVESVMLAHPESWAAYYPGDPQEQKRLRVYSYSDRIRYYWGAPEVQKAVHTLLGNLTKRTIPETMLSYYLPQQYERVRQGSLNSAPLALVLDKIRHAILPYADACNGTSLR